MSSSTVIDDLASRRDMATVIEWAQSGRPIPLGRLQRLAHGSATGVNVREHGAHWVKTLVDALERGGVGVLKREAGGSFVFVPAAEVPSPQEAWQRVEGSWNAPGAMR